MRRNSDQVSKDQMRATGGADASLRKPPATVVPPSDQASGNDEPILPPPSHPANGVKRQVIEMAKAVSSFAALPILEKNKRDMYRHWLAGRDFAVLQIMYRDPVLGLPPRKAIEHTVREMARKQGRVA